MGSPTLRIARLALYLGWTLGLMPVQARRVWRCGGRGRARLPALLSSLVLPHSRASRPRGRGADRRAAGAVRLEPCLLSRHHRARLVDRRLVHRQGRGRALAVVRLAGEIAAHRLCRPPGAQHPPAARRDGRAPGRGRRADPVSRRHQRRRQPGAAVQERAVQRRPSTTPAIVPIAVQPVSIAYTRLDGMPLGRLLRPFFAWYGRLPSWRRICGPCSGSARSRWWSSSIRRH